MDQNKINEKLKHLEEHTYSCLKVVSKYSYDYTISKEDYSKEHLYFELFNALNNYDRAIRAVDLEMKLESRFNAVYKLVLETLLLEGDDYFERLDIFGEQYFSHKRYRDQINAVKEKINFDSFSEIPEDSLIIMENKIFTLFKIRDEINLLNQSQSLFVDYINSLNNINDNILKRYSYFEEKISKEHTRHKWLWSLFYDVIQDYRSALLVPNTELVSSWWYNIEPLSQKSLNVALDQNLSFQKDKVKVGKFISKVMSGQFEKMRINISDTVSWWVDHHKESFAHVLNISKSLSPAFQTWSSEVVKPEESDHALNKDIFSSVPGINHEIIRELIEVAQFDEDIDEGRRKNILATAFLIIGETEKALELLNDD